MAKKTLFACQNCGSQFPKWEGRCRECGAWNTLVEETVSAPTAKALNKSRDHWVEGAAPSLLSDISTESTDQTRFPSGIAELDRVLGGGFVEGGYILLGGDPGIGKSTLLLQVSGLFATSKSDVLYVSAEESIQQTALRARRLGLSQSQIHLLSESRIESILASVEKIKPRLLIIDSIQTVFTEEITSAPGSVSQVRESAARLLRVAKNQNTVVILVGHVTKDGHIAGPRVLEHMVDTVLEFEGDGVHNYRLLRALKNRFGATNELGIFEMSEDGLKAVVNPSEFFLQGRGQDLVGSSIFCAIEGSRPVLCEIQALTHYSPLPSPRRTAVGLDLQRVHILMAVMDKFLDLDLVKRDVFASVVGGLRLREPAADLSLALSVLSSEWSSPIPKDLAAFGEVGLTGEIRGVQFPTERVKEAAKLGFNQIVLPTSQIAGVSKQVDKSIRLIGMESLRDLPKILSNQKKKSKPKESQHHAVDRQVPSVEA